MESAASQNGLNNLLGDEEMDGTEGGGGVWNGGESNNNTMAVDGGEKHLVETSFAESTASPDHCWMKAFCCFLILSWG